jgi:hypothetical protein
MQHRKRQARKTALLLPDQVQSVKIQRRQLSLIRRYLQSVRVVYQAPRGQVLDHRRLVTSALGRRRPSPPARLSVDSACDGLTRSVWL